MLEENMEKDKIKIVNDVAGGSETAEGIRKKVQRILELCKKNKKTLNQAKFRISKTIKVGGFEISSNDTDSNPKMKPSSDYFNEQKDNIKSVNGVTGGSKTAEVIRKKAHCIFELCRKNKITLNPAKFRIS